MSFCLRNRSQIFKNSTFSRLQWVRDRRRAVPVGPEKNGQRGLRSPPQPRAQVSALPPPRVQICAGSLERPQVRAGTLQERSDGRKYSIRFVFALRFEVNFWLLLRVKGMYLQHFFFFVTY